MKATHKLSNLTLHYNCLTVSPPHYQAHHVHYAGDSKLHDTHAELKETKDTTELGEAPVVVKLKDAPTHTHTHTSTPTHIEADWDVVDPVPVKPTVTQTENMHEVGRCRLTMA